VRGVGLLFLAETFCPYKLWKKERLHKRYWGEKLSSGGIQPVASGERNGLVPRRLVKAGTKGLQRNSKTIDTTNTTYIVKMIMRGQRFEEKYGR